MSIGQQGQGPSQLGGQVYPPTIPMKPIGGLPSQNPSMVTSNMAMMINIPQQPLAQPPMTYSQSSTPISGQIPGQTSAIAMMGGESHLTNMIGQGGNRPPGKPQVEFNHAINYVNKIKTRFSPQPEVYKSFLEILHTYQKEQRTIKEVYAQVSNLFRNQTDLLDEFSHFLPEAVPHAEEARQAAVLLHMQQAGMASLDVGPSPLNASDEITTTTNQHALINRSDPLPSNKMGSGVAQHESAFKSDGDGFPLREYTDVKLNGTAIPGDTHISTNHSSLPGEPTLPVRRSSLPIGDDVGIATKMDVDWESDGEETNDDEEQRNHVIEDRRQSVSRNRNRTNDINGDRKGMRSHKRTTGVDLSPVKPITKKAKMSTREKDGVDDLEPKGSYEEFVFFDKVKHALKNKGHSYENFLRLLHLYSADVFEKEELVSAVAPFLSPHKDLFEWFKIFLDYKETESLDAPGNSMTAEPIKTGYHSADYQEVDYSTFKRYGYSYRILPKTHAQPRCTGRTKFHQEFLNDYWLSFPTSTEDSYFVTSKKNQYEEGLYRCEDERYELDMLIQQNLATIKTLEPINKRLQTMSIEDASKLQLDERLEGTSVIIYRKALERLYGPANIQEVMEGLQRNPSIAVPVVLKRLKAKDEEWRRAQIEWNKLWRDANEKNLMKSLDHQAITFKPNDRKAMLPRTLIQEIEAKNEADIEEREGEGEGNSTPNYAFSYDDPDVLKDVSALILHCLYRAQTNIGEADRARISTLIREFIMVLFDCPIMDRNDDVDNQQSSSDEKGNHGDNALPNRKTPTPLEYDSQPIMSEKDWAEKEGIRPIRVKCGSFNGCKKGNHSNSHLMYTNNQWYCFFRLHRTLYERIHRMKYLAMALPSKGTLHLRHKEVAVQLKLKTPCVIPAEHHYSQFLKYVQTLLDQECESGQFEDLTRELYGIHAYITFTIDRLIQSIVRQAQIIVNDDTCQRIRRLYAYETQRKDMMGHWEESIYKINAEAVIGDDNCYRIEYDLFTKTLTIQLLEAIEHTNDPFPDMVDEDWSVFIESYCTNPEPEKDLLSQPMAHPVFLKRNVGNKDPVRTFSGMILSNQLEIKHCAYSHKAFYAEGTYDILYRHVTKATEYPAIGASTIFQSWRQQWLQDNNVTMITTTKPEIKSEIQLRVEPLATPIENENPASPEPIIKREALDDVVL